MKESAEPRERGNGSSTGSAPLKGTAAVDVAGQVEPRTSEPEETAGTQGGAVAGTPRAPRSRSRNKRRGSLKQSGPPRTPADLSIIPEVRKGESPDLSASAYYLNRELTWLNFNFRVLHEAEDSRTPLLERIKFIAIVSSNIDEFFMKRIGGLKQQVGAGIHTVTVDGRTPKQQIDECYALVRDLERRQRDALLAVRTRLSERGVSLTTWDDLSKKEKEEARDHYIENIYPLVTPQASDPAHPFPFISNLSLNLLVSLRQPGEAHPRLARVKVPVGAGIPRLLQLPGKHVFVRMESVMANNLDLLFPEMEVESVAMFRVTRNANTEMEEENADDLLAMIETELRERKFAPVVRLQVDRDMLPLHRGMLAAELQLDEASDVFEVDGMLGMRDLMELTRIDALCDMSGPPLTDPPFQPVDHPQLTSDRSIFHIIRETGSILLNHPYESYSTSVARFLKEASSDPKVRAIKMTLYRTSSDSNEIRHLTEAARNGKQVAVVVELKARFDEEANIRWASRLEEVGIHVTYGVVGLKTHCKLIMVVRQDYGGLRRYIHVGTGNYHSGTARLYSDHGLLTCDDAIARDLTELLNYLTTGFKPKRNYKKVLPAPKILKKAILEKIGREAENHSEASPGLIQIKMNALEDVDVTRALYEAARSGVRIDLIVRDTCRLRPGIEGLSDTVTVISIVGRFLEHSRILYFRNGGDEEYYIGSADLMQRNLESRVELMTPVEDPELRKQLRFVLDTQLSDSVSAWQLQADGSYVRRTPDAGAASGGSQEKLMEWAEKRHKEATRLRRRKPRGITMRNVR